MTQISAMTQTSQCHCAMTPTTAITHKVMTQISATTRTSEMTQASDQQTSQVLIQFRLYDSVRLRSCVPYICTPQWSYF